MWSATDARIQDRAAEEHDAERIRRLPHRVVAPIPETAPVNAIAGMRQSGIVADQTVRRPEVILERDVRPTGPGANRCSRTQLEAPEHQCAYRQHARPA